MNALIDSHCHLHDRQFFSDEQAEAMLKNAKENSVEQVICIGTDPQDSLAACDFSDRHHGVYWTYGIHPEEVNNEKTQNFNHEINQQEKLLSSANLVAIGEVGLDYHHENFNREAQIRLFEQMLQLAKDLNLPVSFHVREAFNDFFAVLKNFPQITGVVHSFTDSKKTLKKILETTDFYIGVNGLATYSTLPMPPLERILLETDAPFLTPTPNRGKINEPAYIKCISEFISTKTGVSEIKVSEITTNNARKLFNLPSSIIC